MALTCAFIAHRIQPHVTNKQKRQVRDLALHHVLVSEDGSSQFSQPTYPLRATLPFPSAA